MGRLPTITPDIAERIRALCANGLRAPTVTKRLRSEGVTISQSTVSRYIRAGLPDVGPGRGPGTIAPSPAGPRVSAPAPGVDGEVAAALEGNDLAPLVQSQAKVSAALANWGRHIDTDPAAVLQFSKLTKIQTDLAAKIVELRPRPEEEAEHFEALGLIARAKLVERARKAAIDRQEERAELLKLRRWLAVLSQESGAG